MSDEYDSHQRIGARCTRIRSFTSRPSEVTDTREKSNGSAYSKKKKVDCSKCYRQFYLDAMVGDTCRECLMQGAK